MNNKNKYFLVFMFLVCILSISAVSATENTIKEVTNTNTKEYNTLETTTHQYNGDVSNSNDDVELKEKENVNDNRQGKSGTDKTTAENDDPLSFNDLNTTINNNTNSTIYLSHDYKYNNNSDYSFIYGVVISRSGIIIDGNGHIIDGAGQARMFTITGENVTIQNLVFTNGTSAYGGAIYWSSANGTIINSTFTNNNATYDAGAIYTGGSANCNVINSTFTGNKATNWGGAIRIQNGNGNVINSTFTNNKAKSGGAIYLSGANNVINSTFTENNASSDGGAIYWNGATSNVINSTFTDNNANYGGAIRIAYDANGNVINSTFTENNASSDGGAIYWNGATNCTVINSTFTNNNANTNGGAIHWVGDNGTVINSTFTDNNANYGGAIYWYGSGGNVKNSYFINNTAASNNLTAVNINKTIILTFKGNETYMNAIYVPDDVTVSFNNVTFWNGTVVTSDNPVKSDCQAGINITIEIYNSEDSLVANVTHMTNATGQVSYDYTSLPAGNYTYKAYHADDRYYTYISTNATITIVKTNTTLVITPITNVKVGQEVIINYKTNSNGTVTIKVNGQKVTGGKFIPTTNGTYNVTIEVAENDYYTAATNQTTFNAKKVVSKIIVRPITAIYDLDKYLVITLKDEENNPITGEVLTVKILGNSLNYVTDAKGQVKIKVPTSGPKTYNPRIKYAGSDKYKASSALGKVTVKKATPKITAKSASYKLKVKAKKYTVSLMNQNKIVKNKKVTIKINGKTYTTKTNSKGQATFTMRNLKKTGTYNAVITATGNYYYNKVTKKVKITVKP